MMSVLFMKETLQEEMETIPLATFAVFSLCRPPLQHTVAGNIGHYFFSEIPGCLN